MKLALVQIIPPKHFSHYYISDIVRLLHFAALELGHDVMVTNGPMPGRLNIFLSWLRFDPNHIQAIIDAKIDYVIIQSEIVTDSGFNTFDDFSMINEKHMNAYLRLLANARMIWDLFDFNIAYLKKVGIRAHLFPLGHMPQMESIQPKADPIWDVVFFGSGSIYRAQLLNDILKKLKLQFFNIQPHFFRDDTIRRSRVVVNIPCDRKVMYHVSPNRVTAALYNNAPVVTVDCRCSTWLKPLVRTLPEDNFVDHLVEYIEAKRYEDDLVQQKNQFQKMKMTTILSKCLQFASMTCDRNIRAGNPDAFTSQTLRLPPASHLR